MNVLFVFSFFSCYVSFSNIFCSFPLIRYVGFILWKRQTMITMPFLLTAMQRLCFRGVSFGIWFSKRCLSCLFSSYGAFDKWHFKQYKRAAYSNSCSWLVTWLLKALSALITNCPLCPLVAKEKRARSKSCNNVHVENKEQIGIFIYVAGTWIIPQVVM